MITLIGDPSSKRTTYFMKAANELQIEVRLLEFAQIDQIDIQSIVKIDPPSHGSSNINSMVTFNQSYIDQLHLLSSAKDLQFVNHPIELITLLDKVACKKRLIGAGIPATPMLSENIRCYADLITLMRATNTFNVFIKPTMGSGAAGVMAFRIHPSKLSCKLYSTAVLIEDDLHNSKRIWISEDPVEIQKILNALLKQPTIIEAWLPKASIGSQTFDLRIVFQFGKIIYRLARGSSNPITNLHLNNQAIPFSALHLSDEKVDEIDQLCIKAMKEFKNINIAGIDVLITKKLTPYIIEINGQGDLIYQDIYQENQIYKHQLIEMRKLNE